jgi:hypothetical protein
MSEQHSSSIAAIAVNYNVFDFIRGQAACRDGEPHEDGQGESYDAGYSAQYTLEQIQGAR